MEIDIKNWLSTNRCRKEAVIRFGSTKMKLYSLNHYVFRIS